jgi:hypothetical protein
MRSYFKAQGLTLAQQDLWMKSCHPQFRAKRGQGAMISWSGPVRPTPVSDTYSIRITYAFSKRPRIDIIAPRLTLAEGAAKLPHVYENDDLCLYYPRYGEWNQNKTIAQYVVPWISLWLMFYETWLATGKWLGGGIEHGNGSKG